MTQIDNHMVVHWNRLEQRNHQASLRSEEQTCAVISYYSHAMWTYFPLINTSILSCICMWPVCNIHRQKQRISFTSSNFVSAAAIGLHHWIQDISSCLHGPPVSWSWGTWSLAPTHWAQLLQRQLLAPLTCAASGFWGYILLMLVCGLHICPLSYLG